MTGSGEAAFQNVLPVKVRALAIGSRDRVDNRRLPFAEHARENRHARIEREEGIERERRIRPTGREGERPMQSDVIGVADRRDGGEPIERASQDNHNESLVRRTARPRDFG